RGAGWRRRRRTDDDPRGPGRDRALDLSFSERDRTPVAGRGLAGDRPAYPVIPPVPSGIVRTVGGRRKRDPARPRVRYARTPDLPTISETARPTIFLPIGHTLFYLSRSYLGGIDGRADTRLRRNLRPAPRGLRRQSAGLRSGPRPAPAALASVRRVPPRPE